MKTFLLSFFLLMGGVLIAQEANRAPLMEHFTNSRCGVCGARNPSFHALRQNFSGQVNHVSFHPRFPYSNCVFYQSNTAGNMIRTDILPVSGTPQVFIDGVRGSTSTLITETEVNAAINTPSYFEMRMEEQLNNSMLEGTVTLTTRGEIPNGKSYRVYVMGVEEVVEYNAPNGEDRHYNVFRRFARGGEGIPFTAAFNDESTTVSFSIDVSNAEDLSQMYALAFIEDNDGAIENSVSKFTQIPVSTDHSVGVDLSVYPNPVQDILTIKGIQGPWQLLNLMGQEVLSGANVSRVLLSHLPKGVYFLRAINTEGEKVVKKVIKE